MSIETELPNMTKEQKEKLDKIRPGDVLKYCENPEYYRLGLETGIGTFLVWEIEPGNKPIMNLTGQIISDQDPYGQAPDTLNIDQIIGLADENEKKLAYLCSEWRDLIKRSNLDMSVEMPEGTTWEQFKKIKGYT